MDLNSWFRGLSLKIKIREKKSMPGEVAEEENPLNTQDQYRIKVHNVILDTVTQSIQTRYSANGALYDDFACLDPRNFGTPRDGGLNTSVNASLGSMKEQHLEGSVPGSVVWPASGRDLSCHIWSHTLSGLQKRQRMEKTWN